MKQIYGFLNQLTESYQQERQPHKLLGLFYLTPEQRLKILEDIMAPYSEEEAKRKRNYLKKSNNLKKRIEVGICRLKRASQTAIASTRFGTIHQRVLKTLA